MRSFIAGAFGGFVGFAVACTAVLALVRPELIKAPASPSAEGAVPAPVVAIVPEVPAPVAAADPAPNAAVTPEPRAPSIEDGPAAGPNSTAAAPAASVVEGAKPAAMPDRPIDAKLAAAAESLRTFRLSVPSMRLPAPQAPATEGTSDPGPVPLATAVAAPTVPITEDEPAAGVPAAAPSMSASRVFARTSTIPRRPATPAAAPTPVLPDIDASALQRASQSIERLSRRMRGPNVG